MTGLHWTIDWSAGGLALAALLAAFALGLSVLNARRLPGRGRAAALVGLRVLSVGVVTAALLQPVWVREVPARTDRVLGVLIDTSGSMARREHGRSRLARAIADARAVAARQRCRLFTFAGRGRATSAAALGKLSAGGATTDLLAGLDALRDIADAGELGAVLVISDGIDHGELGAAVGTSPPPESLRQRLARLGVPIYGRLVGDEQVRDVELTALRASPFAFVRSSLPLSVELAIHGYEDRGGSLALEILRGGRVVDRRELPLAGPVHRSVEVEVQPLELGAEVFSARAVPLPDEATAGNNRRDLRVRVLRDRTRVLHLAGHPSWDTRFMRSHLRADPSVDLVSFYIMVAQGSGYFLRAADTTLIEFPARQLFEEVLDDFDLVIFQDFQFSRFEIERYVPLLSRYVRQGGALLVLGGRQAFSAGGYERSALAELLPVGMRAPGPGKPLYEERPVPLKLSQHGRRHPITRLRADERDNARAWSRLRLPGRNAGLVGRGSALSLVLAGDDTPLLAVARRGRGRVAALGSDGLWTWAFPPEGPDRAATRADYHRLLERLCGWLIRDPEYDRLKLRPGAATARPGRAAAMIAELRDPGGVPVAGAALRFRVAMRQGSLGPWRPIAGVTAADGSLRWSWVPLTAGVARVEVRTEEEDARARTAFAVVAAGEEARRLRPNGRTLKMLAELSGGRIVRGARTDGPIPLRARGGRAATRRVRTELWSHPALGALLLVLLALEWGLRRRWGLA